MLEESFEKDRFGLTGQFLTRNDVFFAYSFGPWTALGYRTPLRCWYMGATVIFDQRSNWAEHFFDHPVTMTSFVPALLDEVCKRIRPRPRGYPTLQVQVGGGFLDASIARKLTSQLGCEVMASYGGTEFRTALANFVRNDEDVVWLTPTFEPGIEIVDEDDHPVPPGTEGLIRIKSAPHEQQSYIDDPQATATHFRNGFFYPGDMAMQREDGRIRILGRVDDVLNLAGQKVAIEPFEDSVRRMLGVESLCVFNQQDESGKDMLVVVIEGSQLPERSRMQTLARQLKQVPQIRFSLINQFPRGENGMMKVNRRKVLELVREALREREAAAG